jgi:glycosyltransferase involved in cell wall biosynthesis
MRICGLIPAYNNEKTIGEVVLNARGYIDPVVVINDGSDDRTAEVAEISGAHVIRVPVNRGKGNALRAGFRYALDNAFDAAITLDADLQHDPSEIPRFVNHYRTHRSDIIVGNRLWQKERIPRVRYVPNRVGTFLFSRLIGQSIKDSQCGFRLYDRRVMQNIYIMTDRFEAESDIMLRAGKRGYTIDFVPIKTIYYEERSHRSYYRPVKDTFHISIVFLKNLFRKER